MDFGAPRAAERCSERQRIQFLQAKGSCWPICGVPTALRRTLIKPAGADRRAVIYLTSTTAKKSKFDFQFILPDARIYELV